MNSGQYKDHAMGEPLYNFTYFSMKYALFPSQNRTTFFVPVIPLSQDETRKCPKTVSIQFEALEEKALKDRRYS